MSKKQSTAQKVRALLSSARKIKLAEQTLENGVVLVSEDFKSGSEVYVKSEDGNIPVPAGEYVLADGRILVVENEGIIASISEAAQPEEAAPAAPPVAAMEEEAGSAPFSEAQVSEIASMIEAAIKKALEQAAPEANPEEVSVQEEVVNVAASRVPTHNPETSNHKLIKIGSKRRASTTDSVFGKLFS